MAWPKKEKDPTKPRATREVRNRYCTSIVRLDGDKTRCGHSPSTHSPYRVKSGLMRYGRCQYCTCVRYSFLEPLIER